jgi:hypothetical protein
VAVNDIAKWRRSLTLVAARRGLLAGLGGWLLAAGAPAFGSADVYARKARRKKKRKTRRRRDGQQFPAPPLVSGPVARTDATCAGTTDLSLAADGNDRIAQTFTAVTSGQLVRADLQIRKLEETFGDYILQLGRVDNFAVPTNDVLAATAVANFTVPEGASIVSFSFAAPAPVVAGVQYALVLTRPGSNQLVWLGHSGDTCGGRAFVSPAQTETFLPASTDLDLNFTVFVGS